MNLHRYFSQGRCVVVVAVSRFLCPRGDTWGIYFTPAMGRFKTITGAQCRSIKWTHMFYRINYLKEARLTDSGSPE